MLLDKNINLVVIGMFLASIILFAISFGNIPSGAESTIATITDAALSVVLALSGMTLFISATQLFKHTSFMDIQTSTVTPN